MNSLQAPFSGLVAYPITPLTNDGELHLSALSTLVRNAVEAGVSGVTVLATSGAGVTFSREERMAVLEAAVAASSTGRTVPVYSAIAAASTREVLHLARDAERAGATGLVLTPFSYLPLTDSEVRVLFAEVSDATELPLCFYNKPAQTQYDVSVDTLMHLVEHSRVVAIKDSMRRDNVAARTRELRDAVGRDFALGLSSDVHLLQALPTVDAWHTGLAALLPHDYVTVWKARQNHAAQGTSHTRLLQLATALTKTPHSVAALHAVARELGMDAGMPRGPLGAASEEEVVQLRRVLGTAAP